MFVGPGDESPVADLTGVTVYVVGANGGGRDLRNWQALRNSGSRTSGERVPDAAAMRRLLRPPFAQ